MCHKVIDSLTLPPMTKEFSVEHLDVKAFAQVAGTLTGRDSLLKYERLSQEAKGLHPDLMVDWRIHGSLRSDGQADVHTIMDLHVVATIPFECQRCLHPVDLELRVDRIFRFVADEATAQALDEHSEEDLLVISRAFNVRELIEDELLMELPVVPAHQVCPTPVQMSVADEDFDIANEQKPNPFAALASLRGKSGDS